MSQWYIGLELGLWCLTPLQRYISCTILEIHVFKLYDGSCTILMNLSFCMQSKKEVFLTIHFQYVGIFLGPIFGICQILWKQIYWQNYFEIVKLKNVKWYSVISIRDCQSFNMKQNVQIIHLKQKKNWTVL